MPLLVATLAWPACNRVAPPVPSAPPVAASDTEAGGPDAPGQAALPEAPPGAEAPEGMVRIEGGTYTYKSGERTVATLDMDVFETTIGEYQACVAAGGCRAVEGGSLLGQGCPTDDPSLPVACVTIPQAEEYCRWKGKRLPNLWEWGWAARGGEEARFYPWGDEPATCERAILGVPPMDAKGPEELGCGREGPWPVGSRPSGVSAHGLHDMMGNVAEWVPTIGAPLGDRNAPPEKYIAHAYKVGGSWRSGLNKTYAPWYLERFPGAQWLVGLLGDTTVTDAVGFRCVKGRSRGTWRRGRGSRSKSTTGRAGGPTAG